MYTYHMKLHTTVHVSGDTIAASSNVKLQTGAQFPESVISEALPGWDSPPTSESFLLCLDI